MANKYDYVNEPGAKELLTKLKIVKDDVNERIDKINDYTTGINLLRGTRDFVLGTGKKVGDFFADNFTNNGFTITKDTDDFAIASCVQSSLSADNVKAIYAQTYKIEPGKTYTFFAECMIDDLNNFTPSVVLCCRTLNSSGGFSTIVSNIESTEIKESGKYYLLKGTITNTNNSPYLQLYGRLQRNGSIHFTKFGIYEGSINHPIWSPSPFDIDTINDMTTGVNLLRGTRDFAAGTNYYPSWRSYTYDGFYFMGTHEIVNNGSFTELHLPNGNNNAYIASPIVHRANEKFTVFCIASFDDDTNLDLSSIIFGIGEGYTSEQKSNLLQNVTPKNLGISDISMLEKNKWYLFVAHVTTTYNDAALLLTISNRSNGGTNKYAWFGIYPGHINNPVYSQSPLDTINAVNGVVPTDKGGTGNVYGACPMNSLANGDDLFKLYEKAPIGTSFYYAYSSSTVTSILNKPISSNAPIAVICNVYDNHQQAQLLCQVFTANGTTRVFNTTIGASSGANQWVELAHISDITAANLQGVVPWEKGGTNCNSRETTVQEIFRGGGALTDADTFPRGIHSWNTSTLHKPGHNYGEIIHFSNADSAWKWQLGFPTSAPFNPLFRSNINNAGWLEWKQLAFLSDITALNVSDLNGIVPITKGGTDADNKDKAWTNLGGGSVGKINTNGTSTQYLNGAGQWTTPPNTNTWIAFAGASSTSAGTAGYVPAPGTGNQDKFFKGDGTWATPTNTTYSVFGKSSSSTAGSQGLVPAPPAGTDTRYLRNDGQWVVPPDNNTWTKFVGATSTSPGTDGYIPAPGIANRNNFLRGDGSWVSIDTSGGSSDAMTPKKAIYKATINKGQTFTSYNTISVNILGVNLEQVSGTFPTGNLTANNHIFMPIYVQIGSNMRPDVIATFKQTNTTFQLTGTILGTVGIYHPSSDASSVSSWDVYFLLQWWS